MRASTSKIPTWTLGLYLFFLALGVFTPRPDIESPDALPLVSNSGGVLPTIGHHILYTDGVLAWVGNFIMLMPLYLLIYDRFPSLRKGSILAICLGATISIECIQIFIPGRVSDIRDVIVNILGAVLVGWLLSKKFKDRHAQCMNL